MSKVYNGDHTTFTFERSAHSWKVRAGLVRKDLRKFAKKWDFVVEPFNGESIVLCRTFVEGSAKLELKIKVECNDAGVAFITYTFVYYFKDAWPNSTYRLGMLIQRWWDNVLSKINGMIKKRGFVVEEYIHEVLV